jgi:2-(1,2-epoxy-1,2-dihydrophenyl)acetyl-CoA isomerase
MSVADLPEGLHAQSAKHEAAPANEPRSVLLGVHDGVAELTLNQPGRRNALDPSMRAQLAEAVAAIRRDRSVRAVILAGTQGHFCAGGDLRALAGAGLDNQGWLQRFQDMNDWVRDLISLDRPVIAAVDGMATGAGMSLALMADLMLATPSARFSASFLRVGLVPDCGCLYTLPRVVGVQRAKELMLSAREFGVEEAQRLGIVMEIVAADGLLARAREIARSFVQASPAAVSLIKRNLAPQGGELAALLDAEAQAQALAMGTAGHRTAVDRLLEKQSPPFNWPNAT